MTKLTVELYGVELGSLIPEGRDFSFRVAPTAFEVYPLSSTIMSLAVPLNLLYTAAQKKRNLTFFAELLPEGQNFDWLVQLLPKNDRSVFGVLKHYGRDIAGALTIYDPDDSSHEHEARLKKVSNADIRYLLGNMPREPLANAPFSGKTSLGGYQGKIVLAMKDDAWHRVRYGQPSTHIVKAPVSEYPTMIYDEAFCMQLAQRLDLTNYPVWIENYDGLDALVIERYDRDKDTITHRIHQEDFNQVLGARGNQKYQELGGKVSAQRIAQTLARFTSQGEVKRFATQLIFAIAIGNLDMHAKNISILHLPDERILLAPTYDQVPLRHQNTDGRLALAVGKECVHANITLAHIVNELTSWKCEVFSSLEETERFAQEHLMVCLEELANMELPEKAYPSLKEEISHFITRLLNGKSIGKVS